MKFGQRITGVIAGFDDKGRGVFDVALGNGKPRRMAVPFTTVGDAIEATFIKRDKTELIGTLERIVTPGPDRVEPPLKKFPGALWLHIAYEAQLRFKRDLINGAFEEAGHAERVETVIPDGPLTAHGSLHFHYRNRMDFAVGPNGEIGMKGFGSWNRFYDVTEDILLSPDTPKILDIFRDFLKTSGLKGWDNRKYEGDLRYVVIREGKNTGERMVIAVVKDLGRVRATHASPLRNLLSPLCTSLLIGEQSLITDISLSQKFETLTGNPWIEEIVNDVRYRIGPNSFFQTNSFMAAELQKIVESFVVPAQAGTWLGSPDSRLRGNDMKILDLYCGLGFFGIFLANESAVHGSRLTVHGFEIDAEAVALAKHNAETNGVADRCDFVSGPAEDLSWKEIPADAVILDPPRSGLHPKVLKTVLEKKPRTIVYVSCNYHRLVEELKQFKTAYRVEHLAALDLFPHTPHVEVIAELQIK